MQSSEELRHKIGSATELLGVVRTMKTLSAVNIRQYERAVTSLADYTRSVTMGLQIALREHSMELSEQLPRGQARVGAIIFGSDAGLCGRFNEQIVDHALTEPAKPESTLLMAVGIRADAAITQRGFKVEKLFSLPSSLAALTEVVQDILLNLEAWRLERELSQLLLFYHRPYQRVNYRPYKQPLYPLDLDWLRSLALRPWDSRTLPSYSMDWQDLFAGLVREYLFVSLYRALAESLASENMARLAAMQSAEQNIERRLAELGLEFNQQRQSAITEEILDIIAGAEALKDSITTPRSK